MGSSALLLACSESSAPTSGASIGQMDDDLPTHACAGSGSGSGGDACEGSSSSGANETPLPCQASDDCREGDVCAAAFGGARPEAFECRAQCIALLDDLSWCADASACCDRGATCNARGYCLFPAPDGSSDGESGDDDTDASGTGTSESSTSESSTSESSTTEGP